MLYASDLDGTLIFSNRHFENVPQDTQIILVEKKDQEEISYMTQKSIEILKVISESVIFVPTTTRTVEQYKRISVFQNMIIPKYVVASNGGKILINGEIDMEWEDCISDRLKQHCSSPMEVFERFYSFAKETCVETYRFADELFWVFIIKRDNLPHDETNSFISWANKNGWQVSIQGRKLYIIPEFIDKWNALEYLNKKNSCEVVFSAGDSLLDYTMLKNSIYSFVPLKGELKTYLDNESLVLDNVVLTQSGGIMAGEEILECIRDTM